MLIMQVHSGSMSASMSKSISLLMSNWYSGGSYQNSILLARQRAC
jgi:hypothetical protein